jgi:hypothetical protein
VHQSGRKDKQISAAGGDNKRFLPAIFTRTILAGVIFRFSKATARDREWSR